MEPIACAEKDNVNHRQAAGVILGIFAVLFVLGALSILAFPHAGQMVYRSHAEAREAECLKIQAAVAGMLRDSHAGRLVAVGPVTDLSLVHTADDNPLCLADYVDDIEGSCVAAGCRYSFTSDGVVLQITN